MNKTEPVTETICHSDINAAYEALCKSGIRTRTCVLAQFARRALNVPETTCVNTGYTSVRVNHADHRHELWELAAGYRSSPAPEFDRIKAGDWGALERFRNNWVGTELTLVPIIS